MAIDEHLRRPLAGSFQKPVLWVQGFRDGLVAPINMIARFDRPPAFRRAILGQWGHDLPGPTSAWGRHDRWGPLRARCGVCRPCDSVAG